MNDPHLSTKPLPKILIIYAHPDPDQSVANKVLIRKARQLEHVTIVDLYATYPDFFIDVHAEHQRLLSHDVIVFQHPLYMYSCPSLLKEWLDMDAYPAPLALYDLNLTHLKRFLASSPTHPN